jgi:GNAT superfamily N-acetyltransferase
MTGKQGAAEVEVRTFGPDAEGDIIRVVNAYIADWPYSRPVSPEVIAHWKTMGDAFQPDHLLIAYRNGEARAFLHGEKTDECFDVHILAVVPAAVDEAAQLLREVEVLARSAGSSRLVGPTWRAYRFYNGYVLGHEPYHPHWERDATDAFVRSGWRLSHASVLMSADLSREVTMEPPPEGYVLAEAKPPWEFAARMFRFAATSGGREVATCTGRLFAELEGPVGQLGFVGTDETHRGRGLARRLVGMSLRKLREWGAAECILATGLDNVPALRAYENAGFDRRYNLNEWSKDLTEN